MNAVITMRKQSRLDLFAPSPRNYDIRKDRSYLLRPLAFVFALLILVAIATNCWSLSYLPRLTIISAVGYDAVSRKQIQSLKRVTDIRLRWFVHDRDQQRKYVKNNTCGLPRFNEFINRNQEHLAVELWKYCVLSTQDNAVYLDRSSPLLIRLPDIASRGSNLAVLGHEAFPNSVHGSLLKLSPDRGYIAKEMLTLLVKTPVEVLEASPMLVPRTLYDLIAKDAGQDELQVGANRGDWHIFQQICKMNPLRRIEGEVMKKSSGDSFRVHTCPAKNQFCCSVVDHERSETIMMNKHPLLPFQKITEPMSRPYNAEGGFYHEEELPYISIVREQKKDRPDDLPETPNLYEIFAERDIMPDEGCLRCLHLRQCETIQRKCSDYMENVCSIVPPPKFLAKDIIITPPLYRRDPSRLIPRIIHQTWYEDLTEEDYPNMSRLVESFKKSGWEYKFYSDDDAKAFLATHFPPEILEAYNSLIPGAFKADLFRYCALLIHGGVYADVDILLETSLDLAIEPDIGFMVPHDEPDAMLWQGFIAAAPGHPFLAKAIESVVNGVRNRFTSIDIDATYCPTPNWKVLHMFDVLFTAGPGIFGASVNRVLGRHGQTEIEAGELQPESDEATDFVHVSDDYTGPKIPGRTVILKQNKWDMEAHRFTLVDRNLLIASTDLKDSDDRQNRKAEDDDSDDEEGEGESKGGGEHYSKAHAKQGIYGIQGLYVDHHMADEDVKFYVDATRQWRMSSSIEKVDE